MSNFVNPTRHIFDYEVVVMVIGNSSKKPGPNEIGKRMRYAESRQTSWHGGGVAYPVVDVQH